MARPYSLLAPHYDGYVGYRQFARARRGFETCMRRHRLTFRRAADLGCGTGLFARYLYRTYGVPVFAVDRSPEMLRVAERRFRGLDVCPLRQDVRRLSLPCPVDLITVHSFTMNQFGGDLPAVVERIWRHLLPGASFFFDMLTPRQEWVSRIEPSVTARVAKRGPLVCLAMNIRSGRDRRAGAEWHCARAYEPERMAGELGRRGFSIADALDAVTLGPLGRHSPAALFLARKPPFSPWS